MAITRKHVDSCSGTTGGCKSVLFLHLHLEFRMFFEMTGRPRSSIRGGAMEETFFNGQQCKPDDRGMREG